MADTSAVYGETVLPECHSSEPQVKMILIAPVYSALSARGLIPPLELPSLVMTWSRRVALTMRLLMCSLKERSLRMWMPSPGQKSL